MSYKDQGNIAEAKAIFILSKMGYTVCKPLSENNSYDLIIESNSLCQRVQVKSTNCKKPSGSFEIDLRTTYNNNSKMENKNRIDGDFDLLFCNTPIGDFLIPEKSIEGYSTITLNTENKYKNFLIG